MQITPDQTACPVCGGDLAFFPLLHHMLCAYMGPEYDFAPSAAGYCCPKCRRDIMPGASDCEIVGTSARCLSCGREMAVSPAPVATSTTGS